MAFRDLVGPMTKDARTGVPLRDRLHDALQSPPMPNRYVAPYLRVVDAVLFAARGYSVRWTMPQAPVIGEERTWGPSVLCYRTVRGTRVELPTVIPGEVHRVASWLQSARTIGWRFAVWQAKREVTWILQRRK